MLHWLAPPQLGIEHPPPVHSVRSQTAFLPSQSIVHPPEQLFIVQVAPWQGSEQLPVCAQSMLQVEPVLQVVWQPPPGSLQLTLHVALAAHSVVQPPPGQDRSHGCDDGPHVNSHVP
jgi:hypothetical protein